MTKRNILIILTGLIWIHSSFFVSNLYPGPRTNSVSLTSEISKEGKDSNKSSKTGSADQTLMDELKEKAPKVFLDCWRCDRDYIRKELSYVNFVRDRTDADIHILVTDESTGSGGNKYTLTFIGKNQFEEMEQILEYSSNETETRDEIREGMLEVMKKGLFPFLIIFSS
jgi:hypothetical protein